MTKYCIKCGSILVPDLSHDGELKKTDRLFLLTICTLLHEEKCLVAPTLARVRAIKRIDAHCGTSLTHTVIKIFTNASPLPVSGSERLVL